MPFVLGGHQILINFWIHQLFIHLADLFLSAAVMAKLSQSLAVQIKRSWGLAGATLLVKYNY